MNERATKKVIVDAGHPSYVFPNVRDITNKNL